MENADLLDRALKYKLLKCNKKDHDDVLNMVCVKNNCKSLMQPACLNCVDKKSHNHSKFNNLKDLLVNLSQ